METGGGNPLVSSSSSSNHASSSSSSCRGSRLNRLLVSMSAWRMPILLCVYVNAYTVYVNVGVHGLICSYNFNIMNTFFLLCRVTQFIHCERGLRSNHYASFVLLIRGVGGGNRGRERWIQSKTHTPLTSLACSPACPSPGHASTSAF